MALKKTIVEMPAMDGLEQKTAAQRLQPGKSAKAINLQKNKQGRLEKRLGMVPLNGVDPYGSGYGISTGLQLGTWNGGVQDTLLIMGRGARPGTTASATTVQAYSDDLGGPLLKGPVSELNIVSDSTVGGAAGAVTSPMCAVSGDYMMSAWIEITGTSTVPAMAYGTLVWMVTQVSTGQTVVAPTLVDSTTTGANITFARLDVVGTTFVIAYSRNINATNDLNIYYRTMTLSALTSGAGWTPGQNSAPSTLVSGNTSSFGAFDLRAADSTHFVLAYEAGTYNIVSRQFTNTGIIVDVFTISPVALLSTWTVVAAPTYQATAYAVRTNTATNHLAVCYSLPSASYNYQVWAAIGNYPTVSQYNSPVVIYTPTAANEAVPFFMDVALCPGSALGRENFVESHSPSGAVWNAANLPATAARSAGFGATATCNISGSINKVTLTNGGIYTSTRTPGNNVGMTVVDANQNVGLMWEMSGGSYPGPILNDDASATTITFIQQPFANTPTTGTTASLAFSASTGIVTATGLSGLSTAQMGFPITISGGATAHAGTFSVITVNGAGTQVTYYDPAGVNDASATVHWSIPSQYAGSPNLVYPLKAVFSGGAGIIQPATATATLNGGLSTALFKITNPGQGYSGTPTAIVSSVDGNGSSAAVTLLTSGGQVSGFIVTSSGSGYDVPPNITIAYPTSTTATMTQSTQCRLIGNAGTTNIQSQNNARIIQNMFFVAGNGSAVSRYTPVDGFGFCCGDATAPGSGTYQTNACSSLTPGLTLASRGLEANGIVYYLGWVPSLTQGSFVILAYDVAASPITSSGISGNGYPMRPCGMLQTRTALSDPGGGLQSASITRTSTISPNMWTGSSNWYLGADSYKTAQVAYVSSSFTDRLSFATGTIQTAPARGPQMATWGNITAIGGAMPMFFDGQNAMEQGFLWSPDEAICTATAGTIPTGSPQGSNIDFFSPTDSYSWIFTWEQFDAMGNLHISARSLPVTITGQNIIDVLGVSPAALAQGQTYSFTFNIPSLGATLRQWPQLLPGLGPPNDIRQYCIPPSGPVSLGMYRTQRNGQTYFRVYDRGFNGTDAGGDSFSLPALLTNNLISNMSGTASNNQVGVVTLTDGLNDSVITRINATSTLPFPLLYTDGTSGNPGSLDNFCPPASNIVCRHKERLFITDGNLVMFTKQRGELLGPGYNTTVNSIFVGGDDAITGLASLDDKLVVFKQNQLYYISGDGPADDGTGSNFSDPQAIPTDAGCISTGSIIPTPEGIYFMSDAGLRLLTRSLSVEYVGGPVEDELSTYPVVTGAVLYPSNNKVIFLANQSDIAPPPPGTYLTGEILIRDYVLDAWTTTQYENTPLGFIASAVAYTNGAQGTWNTSPGLAWHVLSSTGTVIRERTPADTKAYYDGTFPYAYVQSTWVSAPIKMQDLARFRAWDIQVWGVSKDPHGLIISSAIDYGAPGLSKTYTWATIAPGGSTPIPLTQINYYDGRMGEAFQVQVQDISDASSSTGQGFQVLGLSVTTGAYPGQYKLFPGSTK